MGREVSDPRGGRKPVSAARLARAGLAAALGGLLLFLLIAPRPWDVPGGPAFFAREGDALHHVVQRSLFYAAALAAALCAGLLASLRLWTAPAGPAPPARRAPRWLAPALALAVLLGAALRFELATGSLWWDEAWLVQRIVVGGFRPEPSLDGPEPRFVPVPWIRTFFDYEKPTNHLPQSVASRVSVDLWRAARGAPPESFDERALRLPTFGAALATILLVGLLGAAWGHPRAGAAAALLLALHPWHVETATGARGFAFVGLAATGGALALTRALRSASFGDWLAYAASQVLLLWTHPFAVYLSACLGLSAILSLALARRWVALARAAATHALAGVALLLVLAPAIAQVPLWHDVHRSAPGDARSPLRLAAKAGRDIWFHAAVGIPRTLPQTDPGRRYPSLGNLRRERPLLGPTARFAIPALALAGLAELLRRAGPQRAVVAGLACAPLLALGVSAALGHLGQRFHARYLFFLLAAVPLWLAVGVDAVAARLGGARRGAPAAACALAATVLGFAYCVSPALSNLATHPYAGMREAARFLADRPDAAGALRVGVGLGGDTPRVYARDLLHVESGGELRALCERAREQGRPLYLLYGHPGQNRKRRADAFQLIDDPRLFEPLGRFDAVAPEFVYRVLRYTGAPPDAG
jgi:hypothetical protein